MRGSTGGVLIRATRLCREEEERTEACEGYDDYGDRRFDLHSARLLCRLAHNTRGVADACILFVTGHVVILILGNSPRTKLLKLGRCS